MSTSDLPHRPTPWGQMAQTLDQMQLDANRYRAWRDAMLKADTDFIDRMQEALPALVNDHERAPTAAEWDAALDHARQGNP